MATEQRQAYLATLDDAELDFLLHDWHVWARDNQLAPEGDWGTWLLLAGRGFGKTRCCAEWAREETSTGGRSRLALVAPTAADTRDVMVEGESGILAISPPWHMPKYEPSKRRLTWPNGAIATLYSADEPDRLRGPQHDGAWCEEIAAWRYGQETWDMLQMGLRLGNDPRAVAATTPRATKFIKGLLADPTTAATRGTTYDNLANLAPTFRAKILRKYEGTRLGKQELEGLILDDNPNALWQRGNLDDTRVTKHPDLIRVVVAVDPSTTSGEESAECGIIAAGIGSDGHGYVLDDKSLRDSPARWAAEAVTLFHTRQADRIIAEVNNGGDLVEMTIRSVDQSVPYDRIHASRGKLTRAEPVAALYEQRRVHHVGTFAKLEDQLCEWQPGDDSPDRLDALVWAITWLMLMPEAGEAHGFLNVGKSKGW